jgi:hypothetical protein
MTYSETHMVLVKKQETRNQDDTYDEILDDKLPKNMLNVIALRDLRIELCALSTDYIKQRVGVTFIRERKVIKDEPNMHSNRSICFSQFFDHNVNHF